MLSWRSGCCSSTALRYSGVTEPLTTRRNSPSLERLVAALAEIAGARAALDRPGDPGHGDYATNVALRLASERRRPPRELAAEIAAAAAELPLVARAEVAGPGFVNLWLADAWFVGALDEILAAGAAYGGGTAVRQERVQAELVSANPTGPIHVAAARNGAYGDSVGRLLEFAGHDVDREYYYNDAGTQMEKFRASVEARRRGEEPPEDGYHGAYVTELAAQPGDPVPQMLKEIAATLERFRIHFDSWALQSEFERGLHELLQHVDTYENDGAVWARSSAYGDDQDRVVIRSPERGGRPTYRAADIAYLRDKVERGYDRLLYVLGADHHGAAKWYAAAARMLDYDPSRVEVLLYQLVHLTRGGAQAKVSKRRGDVVTLDEFMDEVGVDFARWYLVDRGPDRAIEIDVDLARERSRANAVYYVQYVHARTAGVFREAGDGATVSAEAVEPLQREERDLIMRLVEFPELAVTATERRAPQLVTDYAIRLADDFHRFYHDRTRRKILGTPQEAFRLGLCRATRVVIARCLDLVGVDAPERM